MQGYSHTLVFDNNISLPAKYIYCRVRLNNKKGDQQTVNIYLRVPSQTKCCMELMFLLQH